jgi:class 3 adenylate cyclase
LGAARGLCGNVPSVLRPVLATSVASSPLRLTRCQGHRPRYVQTQDVLARTVVEQHRGRLVRTTGEGILATFDGPGRAIRCAVALNDALRPSGLEIRAGLHTGEIDLRGNDIAGIGVHIAARVVEAAEGGELLASGAVPMLVAGSGLEVRRPRRTLTQRCPRSPAALRSKALTPARRSAGSRSWSLYRTTRPE